MEITIQSDLHPGQERVLSGAKRFNVLRCGRRWGKTTFAKDLLAEAIQFVYPSAYYAPTYKDLSEFFEDVKTVLHPLIRSKSETTKQLRFINGAKLDFWSLDNPDSSRGREYKRIIIDEAEKVHNLRYCWEYTIRPTLANLQGDAWFLSTGKGTSTYFHELTENHTRFDNWAFFTGPSTENPYFPPEEAEEARRQYDPLAYRQEILGEAIAMSNKPFCYSFQKEKHVKECVFNPALTAYLSFDFNVDPITALVSQFGQGWYYHIDEFRLSNSDLYELCDRIRVKYPGVHFVVTGDATGLSRTVATKGNVNNYTIILRELGLSTTQLKLPASNPPVAESRTLTNALLANFPDMRVSPACGYLIEDLQWVQVKDDGSIDKSEDSRRSHLLDCKRYMDNTFFNWWLRK